MWAWQCGLLQRASDVVFGSARKKAIDLEHHERQLQLEEQRLAEAFNRWSYETHLLFEETARQREVSVTQAEQTALEAWVKDHYDVKLKSLQQRRENSEFFKSWIAEEREKDPEWQAQQERERLFQSCGRC